MEGTEKPMIKPRKGKKEECLCGKWGNIMPSGHNYFKVLWTRLVQNLFGEKDQLEEKGGTDQSGEGESFVKWRKHG